MLTLVSGSMAWSAHATSDKSLSSLHLEELTWDAPRESLSAGYTGIVTHILAYEGDSHVEWFEGNFADYIEDKKRRLGDDADMLKKLKFVKFER